MPACSSRSTSRSAPARPIRRRSSACSGPSRGASAYVQPSRRPDDGRFGQNPNRVFKHHQFQVILKPSPDEVQQLYLDSLEACGINPAPARHPVRGRQLGIADARRVGHRLAGDARRHGDHAVHLLPAGRRHRPGADLLRDHLRPRAHRDVPAARRQHLRSRVGRRRDAARVRLQEEIEQSKYAFGQVDMPLEEFSAAHRDLFDRNYALGEKLLASGLVWPALEFCLKCSHLFNILDSSGSIGVTERTAYILRVRQLAVKVARAYVEKTYPPEPADPVSVRRRSMDRELLIEIGCEEMPASWLPGLTLQVAAHLDKRLKDARLTSDRPAESYSTPRRLTARVVEAGRAADRSRGAGHRPAGVGGVQAGRIAHARGRRFREEIRRRGQRARAQPDAEGRLPRVSRASTRQGDRRRARRRAGRPACAT